MKIQKTGIDVRITWHIRIAVNGVCSIETSDTTLKAAAKNSIPNPPAVEYSPCVKSKINGRSNADAMIIESIHALRVAVLLIECAPVFTLQIISPSAQPCKITVEIVDFTVTIPTKQSASSDL